jgi:hypothetical protein
MPDLESVAVYELPPDPHAQGETIDGCQEEEAECHAHEEHHGTQEDCAHTTRGAASGSEEDCAEEDRHEEDRTEEGREEEDGAEEGPQQEDGFEAERREAAVEEAVRPRERGASRRPAASPRALIRGAPADLKRCRTV